MTKFILIFDHGECVGKLEIEPAPDQEAVMEIIDATLPDGGNIYVLHILDMDYGIVISEKTAITMKELGDGKKI
jgi:hypothetical protein